MHGFLPKVLLAASVALGGAGTARTQSPADSRDLETGSEILPSSFTPAASQALYCQRADGHGGPCTCAQCACASGACSAVADPDGVFIVGGDYLFIRPHFSEAVAFAEGRQTPTSFSTTARELDFDYDSNLRAFIGYRSGGSELRFTYWHIEGDTQENGAVTQPGNFIVDPFGNIAGGLVVIDPQSGLFGQTLLGGDRIATRAEVELNIYDIELIRPFRLRAPHWFMSWSAGVRIADIDQFYESTVTAAGLPVARGDFSADFTGAGPRLGLEGRRYFSDGDFALFARGYGSLLVGEYEVASSNTVQMPVTFRAEQFASLTRLVPVAEAEVGGMWQPSEMLRISAGWLFQSWFDLGTSGGRFGGFFAGADDGNVMSFDGLFLRTELAF